MFVREPSFAEHLEKLYLEVGWDNDYQASTASGVDYSTLHNVRTWPEDRKAKRHVLSHENITDLLLGASACGLSDKRYEHWYEVLHKHRIARDMVSALVYSTHKSDPFEKEDSEEHNRTILGSLKKDHEWFDSAVDSAFRAGTQTWGIVSLAAFVEDCVRKGGPALVYVTDDWTLRFVDSVKETVIPLSKYLAIPGVGVLIKGIQSLDDRIVGVLNHIWKGLRKGFGWLKDLRD